MKLSEFGTSLSGMMAAQIAMGAAKQNISNLQTEGYVRQKVNLQQMGPSKAGNASQQIGYGVRALGIERVTDEIKKSQYNSELSSFSYYEYKSTNLKDVEALLGGTGENSLSSLMDGFLESWGEIAKNPNQLSLRGALLAEATKFTTQINRVGKDLDLLQASVTEDLQRNVEEFNRLADKLAKTNEKIGQAGVTPPNSLLDERDQLLSEMSKYAKLEVTFESQNPNVASVRVDGQLAVSGNDFYTLGVEQVNGSSVFQLNGATIQLGEGTIKGALEMAETHIASYENKLNEFATALMTRMNEVIEPSFFTGTKAADMRVNAAITANPALLQTTAANANIAAGIADEVFKDGITYSKYLDSFAVDIASDANLVSSYEEVHSDLLAGLKSDLTSVEGVNLDEEMVNLMMFQNYFAANSKAIKTLDEMYDALFGII